MNKNKLLASSMLGLILTLGGCTYLERNEGVTTFSGDAQAVNEAKSVEDPWNKNAYNNQIDGDGQRLGETVERYKKGEQEQEQSIGAASTSDQ